MHAVPHGVCFGLGFQCFFLNGFSSRRELVMAFFEEFFIFPWSPDINSTNDLPSLSACRPVQASADVGMAPIVQS